MNLATLDLNLLKVLDALLKTESVSKTALRLNVTQSAVSHALKRLRDMFGDPLLVREGASMRATLRALALREPLERAMSDIHALMTATREFDPATSQRTFRLAMSDAMTVEGLPSIVRFVRREAPGIDIVVETGGPVHSARLLVDERADLALGVFPAVPAGLRSEELYRDQLVCIADRSNPRLENGALTLQGFLECPHVTVAQSSDSGIQIDDILRAMGLTRRIVASVPHYLAIPSLITGTDLVAHTRRKLIEVFRSARGLVVMPVPVPFEVPDLIFMQVWHARQDYDRAQIWLRDVVRRALAPPDQSINREATT
ncbi:MAG: LysR family transcriptional regulator [Beijerinckiaceae bacterium]|nr:LysR family transcriptional regulator [Beijerinckiaceae bacterium]